MGVMRSNMVSLAERGEKLQDLQDKSSVLQGTSNAFSNQAKRLQWEMQWQRYRFWLGVCLPILWLTSLYALHHYWGISYAAYATGSFVIFALAFLVSRNASKYLYHL